MEIEAKIWPLAKQLGWPLTERINRWVNLERDCGIYGTHVGVDVRLQTIRGIHWYCWKSLRLTMW